MAPTAGSTVDAKVVAVVRSGAWFASLPAPLAQRLLDDGRMMDLAAGARLFARGDPPDGLYCVVTGAVRIGAFAANGDEALLALLGPPQWFGEIALFDSEARTHDAWAEVDTTLLHLPLARLEQLLAERPRYWKDLGRLLTQKLRLTFAAVEELLLLPPTPRIARRLMTMAGGYGAWAGRSKRVLLVSQEALGAMLSLSRQTVNQSLKELEAAGAIRRSRGAVEIIDMAKLAAQ